MPKLGTEKKNLFLLTLCYTSKFTMGLRYKTLKIYNYKT